MEVRFEARKDGYDLLRMISCLGVILIHVWACISLFTRAKQYATIMQIAILIPVLTTIFA